MNIAIERGPAILLAGVMLFSGLLLGVGAFLGGYVLGEANAPAPPAPTELAERTYNTEDLEAALTVCEVDAGEVQEGSVTLLGVDHPAMNRQCFVVEMGAPEIANREYGFGMGVRPEDVPTEGEYTWSNVHMVWEQTETGRDVTITVQ